MNKNVAKEGILWASNKQKGNEKEKMWQKEGKRGVKSGLTKMAISQNPILPEGNSPKSLLLLNFSMNLSETVRINVNMKFAHTNCGRFLI